MRYKHCVEFSQPQELGLGSFPIAKSSPNKSLSPGEALFATRRLFDLGRLSVSLLNNHSSPPVVVMVEDVSEKRAAQEELRRAQEELHRVRCEELSSAIGHKLPGRSLKRCFSGKGGGQRADCRDLSRSREAESRVAASTPLQVCRDKASSRGAVVGTVKTNRGAVKTKP